MQVKLYFEVSVFIAPESCPIILCVLMFLLFLGHISGFS